MRSEISGTTLPVLTVTLEAGETILAETDRLSWMTSNVAMRTTTGAGGASGFFGVLGRAISGGGLFMTEFTAQGGEALVAFAATVPGNIIETHVAPGQGFLVHRHGFLAGAPSLSVGVGVQQSLGAGVFGGDGFVLQRLTGEGTAFIELGGEIVSYTLQAGQDLLVHPGHVGMFEESVGFEITTVPGVRNMLFGGDGLFLAHLTGPGKVWLQTLTAAKLAHALRPYLPAGEHR
ncbi:TIGR00266 family protein [Xanthobacter dioxanivorans]|uniref:TIGR00266 family protein n=1 Tax=Xanthobacter dioxanivorans TaxID=2528964 RepID=A0A974PN68_9HYPH|nr:TIGR00266 family protein [Xanthobacter dioxanivorans]QRG06411.1 TIGR00266 family protein [Xanthobacter dioxanivorans]